MIELKRNLTIEIKSKNLWKEIWKIEKKNQIK